MISVMVLPRFVGVRRDDSVLGVRLVLFLGRAIRAEKLGDEFAAVLIDELHEGVEIDVTYARPRTTLLPLRLECTRVLGVVAGDELGKTRDEIFFPPRGTPQVGEETVVDVVN